MDRPTMREPAFFFPGGEDACLLIHGFTGSPWHMRYLGETLRDAGYTVYAPLLPGHGETLDAMAKTGWKDWLDAAREAYAFLRKRYRTVSVMGLSMGGLLALLIAEAYPVDALVCLSAALRPNTFGLPFMRIVARFVPRYAWKNEDDGVPYDELRYEHAGYDGVPVRCLYDLYKLGRLAERGLYLVEAPTLVIQPLRDKSVKPVSARIIDERIHATQKRLIWLEQSRHVCTTGPERRQVADAVLEHLKTALSTNSNACSE